MPELCGDTKLLTQLHIISRLVLTHSMKHEPKWNITEEYSLSLVINVSSLQTPCRDSESLIARAFILVT